MNVRTLLARRTAALALVVLAGVPLAGCGGGDNTSSWVGTFCGSGSSLRTVLSSTNDAIRAQLQITDLPPSELKTSVVRGAGSILTASDKAAGRVRDAGEPSVKQGKEIEAAAVAKYAAIGVQVKALQVEANALDASSADRLADGIGPYSQKVADLSRDVAGSLKELAPYRGYAEIEKVSRTPDDYDTADSCTRLQTVAP